MGTGLLVAVLAAAVWAIRKAGADLRNQIRSSRDARRRDP